MRRGSTASSSGSLHTATSGPTRHPSRTVDVRQQLYVRAKNILVKLRRIPQFDAYERLAELPASALPEHLASTLEISPPNTPLDPVSLLRRLLRLGAPLTLLFNTVQAAQPATAIGFQPLEVLSVHDSVDIRLVKRAIYRFCEACVQELGLRIDQDLFTISQIFHNSMPELMAPMKTVELLLARLDSPNTQIPSTSGNALTGPYIDRRRSSNSTYRSSSASLDTTTPSLDSTPTTTATSLDDQRGRVVDELLSTERKYVSELELLNRYFDEMLTVGIPRDTAKQIVPHVSKLLEFQQRFLVGCEHQVHMFAQQPTEQNFGWLFLHLLPEFEVYKQYTLSQKDAVRTAQAEIAALQPLSHLIEPMQGLPMLLLTPVQRIMRYPLLLKSILKHTPETWPHYTELSQALDAMRGMMSDVNETQRRAENVFVTRELQERVRDWRGLDLASMGELLLSGSFPVSNMHQHNSTQPQPNEEQDYYLYLFERALLCCRDRVHPVKKSTLTKMRPSASSVSSRNSQGKSLSLEVRGRIYMGYITAVSYTKLTVGGYLLRLAWGMKNDAAEHGGIEVRLSSEEQSQMWEQTIIRLANAAMAVPQVSQPVAVSQPVPQPAVPSTPAAPNSSNTPNTFRYSFRKSHNSRRASQSSITRSSDEMNFWDDSPASSPIDALRKLSVSSISSQHSEASRSSLQLSQQLQQQMGTTAGNAAIVASASSHYRSSRQKSDSSTSLGAGQRTVRIHVDTDSFMVIMPLDVSFDGFMARVERKLKLTGKMSPQTPMSLIRLEYIDEDNDRVRLESEEDMLMAFEAVPERQELSIYVHGR